MSILIAGLGNPGEVYKQTRHNAGALCVAFLHDVGDFSPFRHDGKTRSTISKGKKGEILAIPDEYMNNSGGPIFALLRYYAIRPKQLIVVHDDKDIVFGTYKVQYDRGSAGHKGVRSIITALGTEAFHRIRIGIGPVPEHIPTERFVLDPFSQDEWDTLHKTVFPKIQTYLVGETR